MLPDPRFLLGLIGCTVTACSGSPSSSGGGGREGGARPACGDAGVLCYELGPVDVPPGSEWQGFQAIDVKNDADLAIVAMEIEQLEATSHHFTVALWKGDARPPLGGPYDLTSPEGLGFISSVTDGALIGSVFRYVRIDTGKYVGVTLPAHSVLVNSAHYLNGGTASAKGHTRVLIRTVPRDQVRFATTNELPGTTDINVPPGETKTVGATWVPPSDVAILLLTSHMHRHGKLFEIWQNTGGSEEKIYSTSDYEAPPLSIFTGTQGDPPIVLRRDRGDQMRFACTHRNDDLSVPLTYGPSALTNEMCIMPVYYVTEPDALLGLIANGNGGGGFSWDVVPNGGK